eukprot:2920059-Prymnesium_polylepis.1
MVAPGGGVGRCARPAVPLASFLIYRCNCPHVFPVIVHTFIPLHSHRSPPHRRYQDPIPESWPL